MGLFGRSIFYKFMGLMVGVIVCNTVLLSLVFLYCLRDYAHRLYTDKVRHLLAFLRYSTAYGLLVGDRGQLVFASKTLLQDPEVAFLVIYDRRGRPFLREGPVAPLVEPEPGRPGLQVYRAGESQLLGGCTPVHVPVDTGEGIVIRRPPESRVVGYVCLGLDLSSLDAFSSRVRRQVLAVSLVLVLLAVGLSYFLGRLISRPLKQLARAARSFSSGKLPEPVRVSSRDEVGELARAFSSMIQEIARSQEELRAHASRLEELVQERTEALRGSLRELEAAYGELQRMHDLKSRFLQKASHELRTPLTVIKANLDYLLSYEAGSLGEEVLEMLAALERNVAYMHRLVEDMLTIVRLQDGRLRLERRPVALRELVQDCVNQLRPLAAGREIAVDIPEDLVLSLDADRFRDVIVNLLSNALRFTGEGDRISFRAEDLGDRVRLYVSDTGEGIPEEHLPHVFEPFYQVSSRRGGTGLGLSIVSGIVQEHGGTVEVESRPGEGTTFVITLPKEG